MAEKFNLKWTDFNSSVIKSFRNIRDDEDLFDVTFACDDQNQISAHKLILSSSSEYFKNIFKQNKNPHPLLCLLDVSSGEMKSILDYIYYGEVDIDKDDLDRFLSISKRLKIEGLSALKENHENLEMEEQNIKAEIEDDLCDSFDDSGSDNKVFLSDVSYEKKETEKTKMKRNKKNQKIVNSDKFENSEELEQKLSAYVERLDGRSFKCTVCDKISNLRFSSMEHVQLHFSGLSFPCNSCDTILKTTAAYRQHMKNIHGNKESLFRKSASWQNMGLD